jgi:PKD repeat protein
MKHRLLWLLFSLLAVSSLAGTQMMVLGEVFSAPWCGSCPNARSALSQLYSNGEAPYLVPLVWNIDPPDETPNGSTRYSWYPGNNYIPWCIWGGTVGAGNDQSYADFLGYYNEVVATDSPIELSVSGGITGDQVTVTAAAHLTGDITITNNKILLVFARHKVDADADYVFLVVDNSEEDFTLTTAGQTATFTHSFTRDMTWELADLRVAAFVQHYAAPKTVYQAAMGDFSSLTALFSANIQSGPADLVVNFSDASVVPADQTITSWEWDLNGDGTVDSEEQNPSYTYTTPGTYDVTLTVTTATDSTASTTSEGYITVTSTDAIAGPVSGVWRPANGVYHIADDITVPLGGQLVIEAGAELRTAEGAKIIVNGKLVADAGGSDPIRFWSADGAAWAGLQFLSCTETSTLRNCDFTGCNQTAVKIDNSPVDVIDCKFHNISVGGVPPVMDIITSNEVNIERCMIANNISTGNCGAICLTNSSPIIKNNLIVNNQGVSTGAILIKNGSNPTMINNTLANNLCTGSYNSCLYVYNASLTLRNNIIKGTGAYQIYPFNATILAEYNDVSSGFDGDGNISVDPLFVSPSGGDGSSFDGIAANWLLQTGSPCIDAGAPSTEYNDLEDPASPGNPLYPAQGTLRNDMGAFGGEGNSFMVGTSDPGSAPAPKGMNLTVSPNPFNPTASIAFTMDQPGQARLTVYNLRGEAVTTLLDQKLAAGRHSVTWNGTDHQGHPVASGVYFVSSSLGSDRYTAVKKMILLK